MPSNRPTWRTRAHNRFEACRRALPASWARHLPLSALLVSMMLTAARLQAQSSIALITSGAAAPFQQAAGAIANTLQGSKPEVRIVRYDLDGHPEKAAATLAEVAQQAPALLITVGTFATKLVLARSWNAPVVFSMVLYPQQSGYRSGANVTGVELDVPLDLQFSTLRQVLPRARRVGVLYNGDETGPIVAAAAAAADRHGLTLATQQIDHPNTVPVVLPSFLSSIDALWLVADSHVLSGPIASALVLESLRMSVPVFGLAPPQVAIGALAAFGSDYADIGIQTGELAVRILNGERAAEIPPLSPRKLRLHLNQRSARHLGIAIPAELERQASEVIR